VAACALTDFRTAHNAGRVAACALTSAQRHWRIICAHLKKTSGCSTTRCRKWRAGARSIHRGVYSFIEKNEDYGHQVIRDEARVDQMEIQIDDMATSLIVRDQPVASDMRLVVVASKSRPIWNAWATLR